jgi:hypothetical protein
MLSLLVLLRRYDLQSLPSHIIIALFKRHGTSTEPKGSPPDAAKIQLIKFQPGKDHILNLVFGLAKRD